MRGDVGQERFGKGVIYSRRDVRCTVQVDLGQEERGKKERDYSSCSSLNTE